MNAPVLWPKPCILKRNGIAVDLASRTITFNGAIMRFDTGRKVNTRFNIVARLVLGPPATYNEILNEIFEGDVEGGPLGGTKYIMVVMHQLDKGLRLVGLKVHREHSCRDNGWRQIWIAAA